MKTIAFALLFALLLCSNALAQGGELETVQKALPEEAADILGELAPDSPDAGQGGLDALWQALKGSTDIFKRALKASAAMLVIVLLGALASSAMTEGSVKSAVMLACVVAVAAVAAGNVTSFIGLARQTLYSLADFSKVLLPTMCSAAVASGAVTSAAAKYAATALFMDILISLGVKVILPLILLYISSVLAGAALDRDTLTSISKLLKWLVTTCLGLLVGAFTLYLSLTGIITGKSDELAVKTVKTAIETLLPVVGSAVSGAAETLVTGAGMVKNTIGIFGLIAVAAVCLTPFLTIGAHYLGYKAAAALSLAVSDKRVAGLIDGLGTAFGLLLGLIGAAGTFLFISLVSSMKAVT